MQKKEKEINFLAIIKKINKVKYQKSFFILSAVCSNNVFKEAFGANKPEL